MHHLRLIISSFSIFLLMPMRTISATIALVSLGMLAACAPATPVQEEPETMSMTFDELLEQGDDFSCTFTDTSDGTSTTGTVYVSSSDERLYGDFQVTDGETYDAHIMHDGMTTYIWTSNMAQGIRFDIGEDESIFGDEETEDGVGIDDEEPIDFACDDWDVDEDLFVPPSDVEFTDFGAMMEGMMQGMGMTGGDGSAMGMTGGDGSPYGINAACSACDQIPDEASKAQCKAAIGC